jgi:hypothetical protein
MNLNRLDVHKTAVNKLGRRVRWQIRVLRQVMEGRTTSYRVRYRNHYVKRYADTAFRISGQGRNVDG